MKGKRRRMDVRVNERIHLSEFLATDTPALVAYLNEREIYNCTLRIPHPYTHRDAKKFLDIASQASRKQGQPIYFAVRQSDQQLIGGCGFDGLTEGHCAELGYWLAKPYWGQGIMTDVLRVLCDFAMVEWNLVRITAHVFESNRRSARVLEKNRFELEGTLRKYHLKDGQFIDSKLYALVSR